MATHTNLSSLFTDIADSIRSVSGGTASIQSDTFPTAIQSLGSGFAKIQTGSYVGTGTYGASNPCSLTFDFVPIYFNIYFNSSLYFNKTQNETSKIFVRGSDTYSFLCCDWLTTEYQQQGNNNFWYYPPSMKSNYTHAFSKKSQDGKTITWYSEEGPNYQRNDYSNTSNNEQTYTYYWIIFA